MGMGGEEKIKGREGGVGGGRDLDHPKILAWRPLCKRNTLYTYSLCQYV